MPCALKVMGPSYDAEMTIRMQIAQNAESEKVAFNHWTIVLDRLQTQKKDASQFSINQLK